MTAANPGENRSVQRVQSVDTIIVGGGLSGIYAAHLLSRSDRSYVVLEARDRLGGRILCPEHQGYFTDLGPSWYWPEVHPKMAHLIQALGLQGYRQFEEGLGCFQRGSGAIQTVSTRDMEPLCWRLSGGMMALVTRLSEDVPRDAVRFGHPVCRIEKNALGGARVSVGALEEEPWARFSASTVILALPPRLAAATILFEPELSHDLTQAMLRIGTWMAGHAKFYALYEEPFWRQAGLSGQAFSQRGPLSEIHDGSNRNGGPYGLTGFVGLPAVQRSNQQRLTEEILDQLEAIYGKPAAQPTICFYRDWARERFTATQFDQPPVYEHPFYEPPSGQTSIWDGVVHFAGTETADEHGGYLEGALTAAERAIINSGGRE